MTALIIIAHENFRDEEYFEPRKVLEENGIQIVTASCDAGVATGKLGRQTNIDITLDDVDADKYAAVIYVGGPGCKQYWDDFNAHKIVKEALVFGKVAAAICSAPVILARAGVLKGKKVTCFSGDAGEVKKEGAIYTGNPVEQDGLIITADGPASATKFGELIVETLREMG